MNVNKLYRLDYAEIIPKLSGSILIFLFVNMIRLFLTIPNYEPWYLTLNKPIFTLPDRLIDPLWLIIYLITAIAFYMIWMMEFSNKKVKQGLYYIIAAVIINLFMVGVFYGLKSPLGGFIVGIILLVLLFFTFNKFNMINKRAAILLVPYIIWIIYLSVLQLGIYVLN